MIISRETISSEDFARLMSLLPDKAPGSKSVPGRPPKYLDRAMTHQERSRLAYLRKKRRDAEAKEQAEADARKVKRKRRRPV